jgi:hypothetical protein
MSALTPGTQGADSARRAAAAILSDRRFHNPSVPRPLHGFLHAIGSVLRRIGNTFAGWVDFAGKLVPGGAVTVWVLLGLVFAGATAIAVRRRALAHARPAGAADGEPATEPAGELEREADRAERDGRFADAVRLRFRAGLARLSEYGEIELARSTPNAQLARQLGSPDFEALARRFDEIAYGSAPADPADAEEARRRWRSVVAGGRR